MNVNITSGGRRIAGGIKHLGQSQNANYSNDNTVSKSLLSAFIACIGLLLLLVGIPNNAYSQSQTYSTAGTFTFNVPTNVTQVIVETWGAGGRGATRSLFQGPGGGGGGGAYARKVIDVTPSSPFTVTVGAGSTSTTAGGDSWFGTAGTVMAKGGNSGSGTTGGAGGTIAASIGDFKFAGGTGSNNGGGGSSAGTASNGNNGSNGTGGAAPTGGGKGGNTQAVGTVPGGGGGSGQYSGAPGNGAAGQVKVSWVIPQITLISPSSICAEGDHNVSLTGANLLGATSVKFNGVDALSFVVNSNTSISAVAPNGVTSGNITVTTVAGTGTSSGTLTVMNNPTVNPITNGGAILCVGDTVDLDSTTPAGVWASSNTGIATVDGDGIVMAVAQGSATITYSITDLGCSTSQSTSIVVNGPIVSSGPASATVLTGATAVFSVAASGSISSYQWKVSTDGGDTFTNLTNDATYSGVDTNILTISNTPFSFNGYIYHVAITALAPCPAYESSGATLNVGDTGIAADPSPVILCSDGPGIAVFDVTAAGSVNSYSWEEDQGLGFFPLSDSTVLGVTYSGTATNQLTVSGLALAHSGWSYRAIVIGPTNNATSNPALLTVNEAITIASPPAAQTVCYTGGNASFTIVPTGPASAFQWQYSSDGVDFNNVVNNTPTGATYSGATTATLSVTTTAATPSAGTYFYRSVVTGTAPCGSATSGNAQLNIYTPVISSHPTASTVAVGNSTTFTVATNEPTPSYQWQSAAAVGGPYANVANATPAGVTYSGDSTATLTVNVAGTAAAATRFYRAIVTSGGCAVNSNGAQLTIAAYCTTSLTSTGNAADIITNVTLTNVSTGANFSQTSSGASPWYTFNNNAPLNIIQGQTLSVATTFGSDPSQHSAIWVDYNRNGVFEAAENVALSTSGSGANSTVTYSFLIPYTSTPGTTRIRVRGASDSAYTAAGACSATTYGETEDYVLNIIAATPCSGDPVVGTVTSNTTLICNSGTATLTVTGYATGFTGLSFQWYNDTGLIPGATGTSFTTPTLTDTHSYYVRHNCSAGGFTDSNIMTITVNKPLVETSAGDFRCGTGNITISATPSAGATIKWYAAATNGSALFTGNNYTITGLASTTTYYAEASIGTCLSTARTPVTATIVPGPALTLSSTSSTICGGFSTPVVSITAGQSDYDSFIWSPAGGVSGDSANGYIFNPAVTTTYTLSVVNSSTGCNRTTTHTVFVNQLPSALAISPSTLTRCSNDAPTLLTASGGSVTNVPILTEDFNNSAPSWSIVTTQGGAAGWSSSNAPYTNVSNPPFSNFSTVNGGKFAVTKGQYTFLGQLNTVITSPAFSTVGYSTAALAFEHGLKTVGGETVKVEISTNGGSTWTQLVAYTSSVGTTTNNAQTTAAASISLNAYLNQPNLKIRYNYAYVNVSFSTLTVYWLIDNVRVTGTDPGKVTWAPTAGLFTNAAGTTPYSGGISTTVYAKPSNTSTYTATVAALTNCNVSNQVTVNVTPAQNFYADTDSDGYGNPLVTYLGCAQTGFVLDNTDCNDSDGNVYQSGTFFIDGDGDGHNVGSATLCYGAIIPPGYSATTIAAGDCDDNDANVYQTGSLYTDADNDGYNDGTTGIICYGDNAPSGYTLTDIGLDCNDAVAAINPGHLEVLYNGIDDNCDGQLDEGFQIVTQVMPSQCGTTVPVINSLISAVTMPQANGYRFEVTNTTTNVVQTIDKTIPYFSLQQLALYDYATTYSIRVMLKRNGVWLGYYGPACLVSSPAVLEPNGAAQVTPSQCGITLASINTLIATTSLAGVTGYRFKIINISDQTAPNQIQTIDRTLHWFSLPMLDSYNYGTTYVIEVAVKTNGAYSNFGSPCQISAPPVPALTDCGGAIPTPATHIATASLAKVTAYRFEVTNLVNNLVTTIDRPVQWFTFNMIPGFVPATQYGVRVALMTGGVYSLFSDACEITSPGFARPETPKGETISKTAFTAVAYPNPFAEGFNLDIKTSSEEKINIKVYDMVGRLLEARNVEAAEIESVQTGNNYPSGVYNVIIQQGENIKTLRVVKR